jgi:biopolymer transport protein TolQ
MLLSGELAAAPPASLAAALLQLQTEPAREAPSGTLWIVTQGSLASKLVLALLVVLSLVSWVVMFAKWRQFRAAESAIGAFMHEFEQADSLEEAQRAADRAHGSPISGVFARAMQFLSHTKPALSPTPERTARLSGSQVEALRLVLDAQTNAERDRLGRMVPWLATIGSVSPLIGLLGTVLGVIAAFTGIVASGSGNLTDVAPGVAEALVATAAALAVAIPAVFGYNLFASRLNRIDGELEGFGSELIALMVREGRI